MAEPALIYAIHGVALLHSPNLLVFSELHLPVNRIKNIRTKCQNVLYSCVHSVQTVICTLGTLM